MDWKPNDRFDLMALSNTTRDLVEGSSNLIEDILEITTLPFLDTRESCHSMRIVMTPERFMFLGETISNEHDLDHSNYNKATSDKDSEN